MDKLAKLRELMLKHGIDTYIIQGGDAHNSEYSASHWGSRNWFSGFTGSAGVVVVTHKQAGLWTDGRYFIQAEKELQGTGIDLYKMRQPGVPTYQDFIEENTQPGSTVGFDGGTFSSADFCALKDKLPGRKFAYDNDLVGILWHDRPAIPSHPVYDLPPAVAGTSAAQKLAVVREQMRENNVDAYLVTALEDIAWLLNVRGSDVAYTPLVYAYALITSTSATIFTNKNKFDHLGTMLQSLGFTLQNYENVHASVAALPGGSTIYYAQDKTNVKLASVVPSCVQFAINSGDFINNLKSQKSTIELDNTRKAYIREGVAMVGTLKWLDESIVAGEHITENTIVTKLQGLRKEQEGYISDSFAAISAFGPNGAIVHYHHSGEGDAIASNSFYLLDTGAQYMGGTTDTTRTISVGNITPTMKRDFTLVLKGHIALSRAIFTQGTTGHALDMLARQPILQSYQNYNHGTGHGIGYCLAVHEGPQGISQAAKPVELMQGMLLSNEPGIYKQGEYGVRIENVLAVQEKCKNDYGTFLYFETLTLCPYDTRAIDTSMLAQDEIDYINAYHATVYQTLSPLLDSSSANWLKNATAKI